MADSKPNSPKGSPLPALLDRAAQQGNLSWQDILEICPWATERPAVLARVVSTLRSRGVEILQEDGGTELETGPLPAPMNPYPNLDQVPTDDAIALYFKEMAITPLLSMEEELTLAQRVASGWQARRDINRHLIQDPERRRELEIQIQDGILAREALIKANTRLVVSIARRYLGHGLPLLDLIQEGNLGLMKAVEKFEHQRGFRFSTYATWWIRQSIVRAIADQGRTIRVPVHMSDRLRQLRRASQDMEQELGRSPTSQELANRLGLTNAKLRWMMQVAQTPLSLESPFSEDDDNELGLIVEDLTVPSPAQAAYENMLRERLEQVLATLSPREARVLRLRYGLGHDRPYTLEEIGQKFGLTRERIRQIEGKALRMLRQPCRARLLRDWS